MELYSQRYPPESVVFTNILPRGNIKQDETCSLIRHGFQESLFMGQEFFLKIYIQYYYCLFNLCIFFQIKKKIFEEKKCPPPHLNHFLKIQWEIHFSEHHVLGRNAPKTNLEQSLYSTLSKKLLSDWIPDLGKCPNQKTRKYVYMRISWVSGVPKKWISHCIFEN